MKPALTSDGIVPFLEDIFSRYGDTEYLGEPVTMSAHMLQCAQFAEENNDSKEVIVAALLHDIGHFTSEVGSFSMNDTADRVHEEAGAELLQHLFPALVVDCIRFHVPAKRYLCKTEPDYFVELSEASVHSLRLQGGPMSEQEVADFKKNPNLDAIVKVRRYDDWSKVPDKPTPDFNHYAPLVKEVVEKHKKV